MRNDAAARTVFATMLSSRMPTSKRTILIGMGLAGTAILCSLIVLLLWTRYSPRGRATFQSHDDVSRLLSVPSASLSRVITSPHSNPHQPSLLANGAAATPSQATALLHAVQDSYRISLDHPAITNYALLTFTIDGRPLRVLAYVESSGRSCFSLFSNGDSGILYGTYEAPSLWGRIENVASSKISTSGPAPVGQ